MLKQFDMVDPLAIVPVEDEKINENEIDENENSG
tara:strand:- start:7546 stop:7647 length:102 start_codon:yes stop_codon:yes gene_type:complete